MLHTSDPLPTSDHFALTELAQGVYAALGREGSPTFSNAGIVDLGQQTLVFDAFELPEAGADLRAAAEELAGRRISYLVISHSHSDHTLGSQAFGPEVSVVSAPAIRDEIAASTGWVWHYKEHPDELAEALQGEQERLGGATDPELRASIARTITRLEHLQAALPSLELRLPDLLFDTKLVLHGTQRRAELRTVAPGHTVCDVYLSLPDDGIVFLGDLGFFQSQPFAVFADLPAWTAFLEEIEGTGVEVFVPGHGPLGTGDDLVLLRQYLRALQEMVATVVGEGGSAEDALQRHLPPPFESWIRANPARWEGNVRSLHEKLASRGM
jgi:glyoxylase-like metal-dependent hydrolase (beta-lactamase superfamily II)